MSNSKSRTHISLRSKCGKCGEHFFVTEEHVGYNKFDQDKAVQLLFIRCPLCGTEYQCEFDVYPNKIEQCSGKQVYPSSTRSGT